MRPHLAWVGLFVACGRPSDVGDWEACWRDGAVVVHEGTPPRTGIDPGPGAVLEASARWGRVPLVATGSRAELLVGFPADASAGENIALGDRPAFFLEGGEIEVFVTRRLEGTAEFVGGDPDFVTIRLDGRATDPTVDLEGLGSVVVAGTIRAPRAGPDGCP